MPRYSLNRNRGWLVHCMTSSEVEGFSAAAATNRATKSTGHMFMVLLISGRAESWMQPADLSVHGLRAVSGLWWINL